MSWTACAQLIKRTATQGRMVLPIYVQSIDVQRDQFTLKLPMLFNSRRTLYTLDRDVLPPPLRLRLSNTSLFRYIQLFLWLVNEGCLRFLTFYRCSFDSSAGLWNTLFIVHANTRSTITHMVNSCLCSRRLNLMGEVFGSFRRRFVGWRLYECLPIRRKYFCTEKGWVCFDSPLMPPTYLAVALSSNTHPLSSRYCTCRCNLRGRFIGNCHRP